MVKKIIYIICMTFLVYCVCLGFLYFINYLWIIQSPLYCLIGVSYVITLVLIHSTLNRFGRCGSAVNYIIVIVSTKFALITISNICA